MAWSCFPMVRKNVPLDDLPLTVAENVSREEADEIVNKFAKRKCVAEIV